MARDVICPRGARTRILHILSDSIPQSVRFTAEPVEAGQALDGVVEVERGGAVVGRKAESAGRKAESAGLEPRNAFRKGFLDSRFAVFVTPDQDTRIVFQSRHFTSTLLFTALGIVVLLGVIAGLSGFVLRRLG